ncbi:tRNA (adenosine(37)-N6)-threonylcarbamoyltransferase complex ATPase subunit type 1 TsaE [Zobellia amurskyensis]|uniref:tRNA threonylcarbamoyladenosine biosynthesis protein TsaE n=1 Tax=Zobellia amurskyensis TaxID=248905 RepID=A0A7X3D349_9FLAO|nr:tRNA (adenosine(37)-N6)-threonylcarbamoyltransferase complex ATPase subunit type 1 TsaE [Zobellia amurskyensis]MUH37924.1 tRNA (adenosine(37)-N6)-threonylcarbamoyltransferase complex ATPase subunit type 1 TsaE [Zobellia amurskyensis]
MDITYTENEIDKIAKTVIEKATEKVLLFHAPMGAGKTTLIKAIAKHLGAADAGNSPTFGIVNEYENHKGELLAYHFDFYRLNDEMEALDMGFDDYLNQDAWVFIEWPEKIASFLPENSTHIHIEILDMNTRIMKIS